MGHSLPLLALLFASCSADSLAPYVDLVQPGEISPVDDTVVTIVGGNFFLHVQVDLDHPKESVADGAFRLRVLQENGTQVVSSAATRIDQQTLTAEIPSGLPFGEYAVEITDPRGQTAVRKNSLTVLYPPGTFSGGRCSTKDDCAANPCVSVPVCVSGQCVYDQPTDTGVLDDCDGFDNDCDGHIDEDYDIDSSCGVGYCQSNNSPSRCDGGVASACSPASPLTSDDATCDGMDDDCDGSSDEDYTPDSTCGVGWCRSTNTASSCSLGLETACTPGTAIPEVPDDGIDQNCSGADTVTCFIDADRDGIGSSRTLLSDDGDCSDAGEAATSGDCDDSLSTGSICAKDCVMHFRDLDGDGFGDPSAPFDSQTCIAPSGFVPNNTDCADTPTSDPACNGLSGNLCNPGLAGADLCDGADNDCDTTVDEDPDLVWFEDADSDGFGNPRSTRSACSQPAGFVSDATDCADLPVADPACNGLAGDQCNPGLVGADGCDGADNDCDTLTDEDADITWFEDQDGDGYGNAASTTLACSQPLGFVASDTDCADLAVDDPNCNDLDGAACNPGLAGSDGCDGADNDCDTLVDEDGTPTWYEDQDGDGYGTADSSIVSCFPPAGYSPFSTDCADLPGSDPGCNDLDGAECNPGEAGNDLCDGADNDCDGSIDEDGLISWYEDADADGFGNALSVLDACSQPAGYVSNNTDCADAADSDPACNGLGGAMCNPGLAGSDVCDGANNDCDGTWDEDPDTVWYEDADGDTYGFASSRQFACAQPAGFVANNADCADFSGADPNCNGLAGAACNPGLAGHDGCDGADNDCDGPVDENPDLDWYVDADDDGHGSGPVSETTCNPPAGHAGDDIDCDDTLATGATCWDSCQQAYADTDGDGFGDPFLPAPAPTCVPPPGAAFDSGDCDDLVPSCNTDCVTDIDMDSKPDCNDPCIGGADCSSTCGVGCCEESCSAGCTFSCSDPACPCYLNCSGSPDECKASCKSGATCEVDCHGAADCNLDCKNNETSCEFDCSDVPGTCTATCKSGAPCSIDCTNTETCDLTCKDNGTLCEFDCGGSTTCDVVCKSGAECLLDCTGATTCAFSTCDGGETTCLDDIIVCNRPCP